MLIEDSFEPCDHPGCKSHVSHPCEGCGRQWGTILEKPEIVVLCGSSRFVREMAILAWTLERDEHVIVMGLHLLPHDYTTAADHLAEVQGVAEQMDELHLRKIDIADRVFVVNLGGYVGDSTRREIDYAKQHGKRVTFLETNERRKQ